MIDNKAIQEAGEQVGKAMLAGTNNFTGSVKFNFKKGRLINWNIENSGWPKKQPQRLTGLGMGGGFSRPKLVGSEEAIA